MTTEELKTLKGTESSAPSVPPDGGVSKEPQKGGEIAQWVNFYPLIGTIHQVLHYAYSFLILIHVCLSLASGGQLVQHVAHPRATGL
jgi:hypothetical protein